MSSCNTLIEAERTGFSVRFVCHLLGVSRSIYYGRRDGPPSGRSHEDIALTEKVRSTGTAAKPTAGK